MFAVSTITMFSACAHNMTNSKDWFVCFNSLSEIRKKNIMEYVEYHTLTIIDV